MTNLLFKHHNTHVQGFSDTGTEDFRQNDTFQATTIFNRNRQTGIDIGSGYWVVVSLHIQKGQFS